MTHTTTPVWSKTTIQIGPVPRAPRLTKPLNRRVRVAIQEHDKKRQAKRSKDRQMRKAISDAIVARLVKVFREQFSNGVLDVTESQDTKDVAPL